MPILIKNIAGATKLQISESQNKIVKTNCYLAWQICLQHPRPDKLQQFLFAFFEVHCTMKI